MTGSATVAAIVLAGGRAARMGGVDKPQLTVDGATLLDHAVRAVAWCDPVVVVGPTAPVDREVVWTREIPEFGGPVAAIGAGLALIDAGEVCILAADIPRAVAGIAVLRAHPLRRSDAVCLADAEGRAQWLMGRYRTSALRAALDELSDAGRNASVRTLLSGLRIDLVEADALVADVDTWDDLERARAHSTPARGPCDQEA